MAFIVTENCEGCRFTVCASCCPVDAFFLGPTMVVIDPVECIDCGACVPVCPVDAIFAEGDLPKEQEKWIKFNEEMATSGEWPLIKIEIPPLPGAHERRTALGFEDKIQYGLDNILNADPGQIGRDKSGAAYVISADPADPADPSPNDQA